MEIQWVVISSFLGGIAFTSLFGQLCVGCFRVVSAKIAVCLGIATIPKLKIDVAQPANRASQDFLELIHLMVVNEGLHHARHVLDAEDAEIRIQINDKNYDLMFQTVSGTKLTRDLIRGERNLVPLVARSSEYFRWNGKMLEPNICYVIDNPFFTQDMTEATLSIGIYDVGIRIRYKYEGKGGKFVVNSLFRLSIPDKGKISIIEL